MYLNGLLLRPALDDTKRFYCYLLWYAYKLLQNMRAGGLPGTGTSYATGAPIPHMRSILGKEVCTDTMMHSRYLVELYRVPMRK